MRPPTTLIFDLDLLLQLRDCRNLFNASPRILKDRDEEKSESSIEDTCSSGVIHSLVACVNLVKIFYFVCKTQQAI